MMKLQRTVYVILAVLTMVAAGPSVAVDVLPGLDLWATQPGATWSNHFNSAAGGTPIPADFFGPGSDPFDGQIALVGVPFPPPFGNADTIVERLGTAFLPDCPSEDTVPIQIKALHLVSADPITITFNGGQDPTGYDVKVCLSDTLPQLEGSMTIRYECEEGGSVDETATNLPVRAKMTFSPVVPGPPDVAMEVEDNFHFVGPAIPVGWVYDPDPELEIVQVPPGLQVDGDCDGLLDDPLLVGSSNFVLGVWPEPCECDTPPGEGFQIKKPTAEESLLARHGVLPPEFETPKDCCLPDGTCLPAIPDTICFAQDGGVVPLGTCTVPEACCLPDDTCIMADPVCCEWQGGTPMGLDTVCLGDSNGDGADDLCVSIPAVSEWGLIVMALLGLAAGTVMFRRARAVAA